VRKIIITLCTLGVLAVCRHSAFAQEGGLGDEAGRPWAKGVSPDDQKIALDLFQEGNALLKDSAFVEAAKKYRDALSHWDHPAIHYNLALALLNLDQPVEVYKHLEKAMAYGAEPLDTEKFEHAKSYKALIEKQLNHFDLVCNVAGAQVTLDGKQLFVGPGKWSDIVRDGPHTVSAEKAGYVATQKNIDLVGGQSTHLELKLYTAEDLTLYKRRWKTWKPWAAFAGGVALAVGGVVFTVEAGSEFKAYDNAISQCGGCMPTSSISSHKSLGNTMEALSVVSYTVGGAAILTGLVLVYVNRPHPYRVEATDHPVAVAPMLGPQIAGVMLQGSF
jgi:hypothetical protein